MKWLRDPSNGYWMVKGGASETECVQLRAEAASLRRAAHPGVVELGEVTTEEGGLLTIRTRYVGPDLTRVGPLAAAEVAGLGAAIATILADLHDLGLAHGALRAEHVLVDPAGRPVLCGLSLAADPDPVADIASLRTLLRTQLTEPVPGKLAKLVDGRARPVTARRLAESLTHCVPDARLPSPDSVGKQPRPRLVPPPAGADISVPPVPPVATRPPDIDARPSAATRRAPKRWVRKPWPVNRRSAGRGIRPAVAAGAALLVLVLGLLVWSAHRSHDPPAVAPPVPCPLVDDGCRPVPLDHGMFTTTAGRFAIDLKAAVVVVGRWFCGGTALPAALDPATGEVWAWRAWPGSTVLSAQTVARVNGAVGLGVKPELSGCDALVVHRRAGLPSVVKVLSHA